MKLKKCSKCGQLKKLDKFNKKKSNSDGLRYLCKDCENKTYKEKYQNRFSKKQQEEFIKKHYKNEEKECFSCKKIKKLSEFSKYKRKPDGLNIDCKDCANKKRKIIEEKLYTEENQKKYREKNYLNNKKICNVCGENKDISEFYISLKKKDGLNRMCIQCSKEWNKNNLEKLRMYQQKRRKEKSYQVKQRISGVLNGVLRGVYFKSKIFEKLGFSPIDFLKHIEKNFQKGMNFNNYGKWQVDYIIPYKYKKNNGEYYWNLKELENYDSEEFKKFNSLDNLSPKWKNENLSKCNKYVG